MTIAAYTIAGMTCGGCVRSVTQALQRALPEARIHVQLDCQRVQIEGEHDEARVREAVEDAGFEWIGAQPPPIRS